MKNFKNIIGIGIAALILALGLVACSPSENASESTSESTCGHNYYGDCDARCHECGEKRTVTVQHNWQPVLDNATCNDREACQGCGAVKGDYIEHIWLDADCHTPKTCKTCGDTEGEALEHDMSLWDYNDRNHGKKCALCGTVDGENRTAHVLGDDYTCECGYKPTQQKNVFDDGEYEIVLYASNENVIKSVWYTADGEYNGHTDYLYDENWNCIRENFYTWDGVLWSYAIYENNEKGQRVKSSNYSGEGELYGYEVNEYNSLGKISGITWYDSNGQAERYVNYEYDENENMIKEIEGDTDGNKYIGEYDSEGKLLRDIIEGNDGGKSVIEYEYDANGNNIKSVSRYYDESGTPIYTSTEIYDENGNTVVEENVEHYPDGDVVLKYLYECDENGLRIKETRYVNDELEYISNYTYNEYGQEISSVESDAEGEITRTTKTEYYDNGNRKSYIRYYDDSDVIEDESYFYENGAVQTVRIYDTSGVLCEESHYDEDGNLIEQESL